MRSVDRDAATSSTGDISGFNRSVSRRRLNPMSSFTVLKNHRSEGTAMSIIGWIILGLISGFIASKIVNRTGEGFFLDIVLGIVGAIVGGFIFTAVGSNRGHRFQSLQHVRRGDRGYRRARLVSRGI
jgi:uncharacterized membrane protein YeaQ/YmgE (transglycosylase-associated protein family)